ncbi:MAG: hypothetical protein N3G80_00485 [Candidatus Micrarchaeota archaeon]|nr:hypothetical protein [Candidatus Micrarchaeota archaeon]
MLFTTSKAKSLLARQIALAFACATPNAKFFGRGKRSLERLAKHASKRGIERICVVSPAALIFFAIKDKLPVMLLPRILIKKITVRPPHFRKLAQASRLSFSGKNAAIFRRLFGKVLPSESGWRYILCASNRLCLKLNGKKVMELVVGYEK